MKKIYLFLMVVIILILLSQSVFASDLNYSITDNNFLINITDGSNSYVKSINIKYIDNLKYLPIRDLGEAFEGKVSWDNDTRSIKIIYKDEQILLKNLSNEVFVNGNKIIYDYNVVIINGVSYAPIEIYKLFTNEYIDSIENKKIEDKQDNFSIINGVNCDKLFFKGTYEIINSFLLENPNRLVIDLLNFDYTIKLKEGATFKNIRTYRNDNGSLRVVIDLNEKYKYTIYHENDGIVFLISTDGIFNDEIIPFKITDNKIVINTNDYKNYKISRLSNPFRIIVDIPNLLTTKIYKINSDNKFINDVKSYSIKEGTRFEISTIAQCRFETEKNNDNLSILIYKPTVLGVNYYNYGDRKYIEIKGISLANKSNAKLKYYKQSISDDGLIYKITFKDNTYGIAPGQIYVNDDIINSIYVERNNTSVTIIIKSKQILKYYINSETKNSNINIMPIIKEPFVIIDPGHGGFDPGAINGDIHESDLTLDIALKLKILLEKNNIHTYILRETDEYLGIYERADIANAMGATLFVSVHINALADENFDGIMTLAYPGSINYDSPNGKLLATLIQKNVILSTDAKDLGIIDRDKLVVLKNTSMPSALVECGFITNQDEVNKLLESDYQLKIASGIKEGILKTLEYIR